MEEGYGYNGLGTIPANIYSDTRGMLIVRKGIDGLLASQCALISHMNLCLTLMIGPDMSLHVGSGAEILMAVIKNTLEGYEYKVNN